MNKHQTCKHFGYRACKHKEDEIMKKATQTITEYHGGSIQYVSFPSSEEIDAICSACDKFVLK